MVYNASAAAYRPFTSGIRYIMDIKKVIVRVPATTANLGSGFDCLGMALEVHNTVTAQVVPSGLDVRITGEGEEALRWGEENRVLRAMRLVYQQAGRRLPGLRLDLENAIPLGRGLGSSAAASVGGLVAANTLCDNALTNDQLLALAVRLEGHPDNVAPALLGGLVVAITEGDRLVCAPVPVPPGLMAAGFVPDFPMATEAARRVLPGRSTWADAVYNVGRAALLVASFATGQPDLLDVATGDRLHQPYRQAIFPGMKKPQWNELIYFPFIWSGFHRTIFKFFLFVALIVNTIIFTPFIIQNGWFVSKKCGYSLSYFQLQTLYSKNLFGEVTF